jgi:uncharacterized repeat protein (TIGR03803 family)
LLFKSGNLYGTTLAGGRAGCGLGRGTVFELSPGGSGEWAETLLYEFSSDIDGVQPFSVLTPGPDGNFYGTTLTGGTNEDGVVFEITP